MILRPGSEILLALCGGAALMDIKTEKVANGWLLLWIAMGGVDALRRGVWRTVLPGTLGEHFLAVLLPFLLLTPFFYFRMIGAGDIKLLMTAALFMRGREALWLLFWTFAFAAGISVVFLLDGEAARARFGILRQYAGNWLATGQRRPYLDKKSPGAAVHMAVPVLMAALLWCGGIF